MRTLIDRLVFVFALVLIFLLTPLTAYAHTVLSKGEIPPLWYTVKGIRTLPLQSSSHLGGKIRLNGTVWDTNSHWVGWYDGDGSETFNFVEGDWSNPCTYQPIDYAHQLVNWVGLGGVHGGINSTLLQAGTWLRPDGQFHLFYELVGASDSSPHFSSMTFQCGDFIHAEVDYNYYQTGTYKNHIYIQVKARDDRTVLATIDYAVPDANFIPDLYSADWIDERPVCSDNVAPLYYNFTYLPDFVSVHWSNGHADRIGYGIGAIGDFQTTNETMRQDISNAPLAHSITPGETSTSFTDAWDGFSTDGGACP